MYGVSKEQLYIFNNGEDYQSYNVFGAHIIDYNSKSGVRFLVYAPNAVEVYVVGDFNNWTKDEKYKMETFDTTGCLILFIEGLKQYDKYKYLIITKDNKEIYKSDPYAFYSEVRPGTASIIYDINNYKWDDDDFIKERNKINHFTNPKNIYEVHLGSFAKKIYKDNKWVIPKKLTDAYQEVEDKTNVPSEAFLNYREIAKLLIPYVKNMGYTHIEIMPLHEYPFDGSWGYQDTGYFSITSRYGTPEDYMYFVNECHKNNIYVIQDFVPGHFCMDDHGLRYFDGTRTFDGKEHKHWGTMTFDFSKHEVISFLKSSAIFLIDKYHIDGIRFDGVSSMVYLNYGVNDENEKVYNKYGDDGNLDAMAYLQNINQIIGSKYKGVITIAEESTAWGKVTKPKDVGGLGFHYKWDMGWMHDTLDYLRTDFPYRSDNHNKFTFSMSYAEAENYVLSLSHDEVVHGKASLINKMPGDYDEKFAQLRTLLIYQLTRPGAKLNFMGNEIPEFIEWRYYESLEWFLLNVDKHKKHHDFVKYANNLYLQEKSFYEKDMKIWEGFNWIDSGNYKQNIFIYERIAEDINDRNIVILNFGKNNINNFRLGVNKIGKYLETLNTNDEKWGGNGEHINKKIIESENIFSHGRSDSIEVKVPSLSAIILKYKMVDKIR